MLPGKWVVALVLGGLLATATTAHSEERKFVFALDASHMMPLGQHDPKTMVPMDGIVLRLERALANKLEIDAEYRTMPTLRLETSLRNGEADAFCYVKPEWMQGPRDAYQWSKVIFNDSDLLIRHLGAPDIGALSQLRNGTRIGTLLGYVYPELSAYFSNGKLVRDETYLLENNLKKLEARRFDYMVINQMNFDFYRSRHAMAASELAVALVLSKNPLRCALSRNSSVSIERFDRAIESLEKEGRISAILERYR